MGGCLGVLARPAAGDPDRNGGGDSPDNEDEE
jgi:hypothetical protein